MVFGRVNYQGKLGFTYHMSQLPADDTHEISSLFSSPEQEALKVAGFSQALEIMESLENHTKKSSMHGKIMEFEKT